ncbi:hypothetical protein ACRDU6_23795 [Mycolicibacterium sp. ELW1]|uniref:hypothetical protein n=1 Tax=Mycobacteriaceae TaxID=1762 RepID=UPI00257082D5|nr:hypothetical protein [Mycobacterium sp. ELW1]
MAAIATAQASPNVVGEKYADASSALSSAGYTPVVSVTVGDHLHWPDCVVVRQQDRTAQPPANSGGSGTKQTLVSLNCDAAVASAVDPGNSLGSPEGRAAKAAEQQAAQQAASQ